MDTPENTTPVNPPENTTPVNPENPVTPSLLDEIIKTSHETSDAINEPIVPPLNPTTSTQNIESIPVQSNNNQPTTPKKPRDPLTAGMVFKLIGTFLLIAIIFFGSFLAYVAFNPEQAGFFVNIFGINPNDIQDILKRLINGSFWVIVLVFSIIWIITLFKAIWTPKDQKRKRLLGWLTASIVGVFLFMMLGFWAYLFNIINATDYANTGWEVTIYDNDIYIYEQYRDYARVTSTNNIIGPITLRYDLSSNAKAVSKKNLITIDSYEINFDGAKCINDRSIINWSDPINEQWLICTFDQTRTYNIRWTYTGKDRLGETVVINIPLNTIEIKGLLDVSKNTNKNKKRVITINASKVKNLGEPRWVYATSQDVENKQSSITEEISSTPLMVCLKVINKACDRIFIISDNDEKTNQIEGTIVFNPDTSNALKSILTLSGINISSNEITNIDWVTSEGARLCQWVSERCEYTFSNYGVQTVIATILLANKKTYTIQWITSLSAPLRLIRHGELIDQNNAVLNTNETYDLDTNSFIIKDIAIPSKLTLDARDILLENPGYKIRDITWKISDGTNTEEKVWEKVTVDIVKNQRYTIQAVYNFDKTIITNTPEPYIARDNFIIDLEQKPLESIFTIQKSSDYTPSKVTVDASSSQSKNGTIQKFIFDFGEGRTPAQGDAIQTYEYRTPGEKKITVTVIDNNNEQSETTKYLVLKDTPKTVSFSTSMSPWFTGAPVDFIADGATGQIEEWIWNFGDNTPAEKWYEVTHSFEKVGTYSVQLTIRYIDGTERSTTQTFKVENSSEL
jgi:PKD repeat protein